MKHHFLPTRTQNSNSKLALSLALLALTSSLLTLPAAVPLRWTVETSRATPAAFEAYQGETLELEAALTSHGKPLQAPFHYALYWQTNGMGSVYWSTNCATGAGATNVMRATWRPEYDAGAKVYNCFIGAPGDIYHAAFQLRLRPSPGAVPGALPLPTPTIDFARVTVLNPPWPTNDLTSAVASNAAAIASHSSQLSQLTQAVAAHTNDTTNNPHRVTAAQVGAVPWANDAHNAVTIGTREGGSAIGERSFAQGFKVKATGSITHAEGYATHAEGNYTHAEGSYTHAEGYATHAEGNQTHAEGNQTHAEGYYTHAEGYHTHAEGNHTHAEGNYTHAEGNYTHAEGSVTHAEGSNTHAEGYYTHAEGYHTHAEGYYTHAEGGYTTAGKPTGQKGLGAHASGYNAYATNTTAFTWNGSVFDSPSTNSVSANYVAPYGDHGNGTFNLNPVGGLSGFWVGETNMADYISNAVTDAINYTDAAVAALDATLREYPRIVRRGGMYYTEDIIDRGGEDITYALTRFPVVSFSAVGAASSLTVTKTATAAVSLEVGDGCADFAPLEFGRAYPLPAGATLYVRAPVGVTNSTLYGCKVATAGKVAVGGNIMALVSQDAPLKISGASCFKELFKGSLGIVDASGLSLPATNLANYCYQKMFDGCMEMVRGPKLLPALQPSVGCYYTMFSDCRKMTEGPVIMLDNVNKSTACSWMFVDCWLMTSLSMPNCRGSATQNNGMRGMIQNTGNVRLISVPKLETFYACDQWIFMGEDKPYYPWPTDGTFVCPAALGDNETIARGVSACPPGWTVINK